jgi:uncharacterized protein
MDYKGAVNHILGRLEKELPEHLYYHDKNHTKDVLETVERIAKHEQVTNEHVKILLVGAAYHDCGFIHGHKNHEETGCDIARNALPQFGFNDSTIELVCQMIMATKVPQSPTCKLCEILCDADLDYLGRDDFEPIAKSLFNELQHLGIVESEEAWNRIQVGFLKQHHYHTTYGKELRQPVKEKHLKELEAIVSGYDS